jgi:hypothetical protein
MKKADAQLKEWSAQIALLKAKADNAKADAKIEYHKPSKPCSESRTKPRRR